MITQLENNVLHWVYSTTSSRILRYPLHWENGRIFPNPNYGRLQTAVFACIILFQIPFSIMQLPSRIDRGNVNASILQVIYTLKHVGHFIVRMDIWIFQSELIQVINQSLDINSIWGNELEFIFRVK